MLPLDTFNQLLALGTIVLGVVSLGLLFEHVFRISIGSFVEQYLLWIALAAASLGITGTLVHSYLYGLPPCPLCWWQRIFLYPQALLFAFLLWRGSSIDVRRFGFDFSILLSVIGLTIALYHHALQMFPNGTLPCPSQGEISCAQILFLEYGFLTYPLMAAVLFAFLIVTVLHLRRANT